MTRLRLALPLSLVALTGFAAPVVEASEFPARPIRWIIPFAPGGSADAVARLVQPGLGEALGQQVILDNRPGASSTIGASMAAKAAPDGYTLLQVTTTHAVNPSLMKLPFDPVKDFSPVSLLAVQPNILAVHPSVPARSVKELVELARKSPGQLGFASGGNGSSPHLSGELLNLVAGIKLIHVPYKSAGPGINDLLGGHVPMMFAGPLGIQAFVQSGRLRALAVADTRRNRLLKDVPTMTEAGFAGVETSTWFGMLAPAGTAPQIVALVNKATIKALGTPELRSRLDAMGVDIVASTPEAFGKHLVDEIVKWGKVVKAAGITAN